MRKGYTLVEMLIVLVVIGIVTAIIVPGASRSADRIAVEHQAARIVAAYRQAWIAARTEQRLAILRIAPDSIAIRTVRGAADPDTILVMLQPGPNVAGVTLQNPHTAIFGPDGVGLGASNTTHVLVKGDVTRRIVVSRLGRVRESR